MVSWIVNPIIYFFNIHQFVNFAVYHLHFKNSFPREKETKVEESQEQVLALVIRL